MERGHGAGSRSELPTVTAVVPTYRRASRLEACVRALLTDPATTEVIVAIDGEGDGSYEVAARLRESDPRVLAFEQAHSGTHAARAAAVDRASAEVVLLVDDDVVAETASSPVMRSGTRTPSTWSSSATCPSSRARVTTRRCGSSPTSTPASTRPTAAEIEADPRLVLLHLWGGNVSLRRSDFLSVEVDAWPGAHEDQYFGIRCHQSGLTGVFDRSLHAEHRHQRDARQPSWPRRGCEELPSGSCTPSTPTCSASSIRLGRRRRSPVRRAGSSVGLPPRPAAGISCSRSSGRRRSPTEPAARGPSPPPTGSPDASSSRPGLDRPSRPSERGSRRDQPLRRRPTWRRRALDLLFAHGLDASAAGTASPPGSASGTSERRRPQYAEAAATPAATNSGSGRPPEVM